MPATSAQDVHLAEFAALRAEITSRTASQNGLMTFTLAAVGALGSFAFSSAHGNRPVLLLLVPLNATTGFLWLDHAHAIYKIGNYTRAVLWPEMRKAGSATLPTYEEYVLKNRPIWVERSIFIFPFIVLFLGPMIAALISLASSLNVDFVGLFWAIDALLACIFAISWLRVMTEFWRTHVDVTHGR